MVGKAIGCLIALVFVSSQTELLRKFMNWCATGSQGEDVGKKWRDLRWILFEKLPDGVILEMIWKGYTDPISSIF